MHVESEGDLETGQCQDHVEHFVEVPVDCLALHDSQATPEAEKGTKGSCGDCTVGTEHTAEPRSLGVTPSGVTFRVPKSLHD